ncbi:TetR/AcrR family transcriptional regulator C-terminal domain-containing protein [Kutzneria viridogrisea]|uniref:GntR family transcription regulator n=2 Tax=Kutzneria TaxID=43356 RepID=W5W7H0_9PSEU|nr:TetR/AcrR family transcriptional regulator C-terminal domain-containing protein [Kutzneria albida]AHH96501.1 GntR family transcription regulator [Kutzneria albida DSM 43870]MBA8928281.1 DNA-binding transcriptional regulator YhcF (GntR family) [Kutzneria viridogrisea]
MPAADSPYARIVAELRQRIASGELRPGDRVPSTRQITQRWGVAMATASKVLAELRQRGLVRVEPGVGTVVLGRPGQRDRAPGQEVTTELVVHTAIRIADEEGLAALSMRRIATELGVATMSLYRHVPSKDELVVLMVNTVFGEIEYPRVPPRGWRPRLELAAREQWAVYRRHPWLAPVMSMSRPLVAPNAIAQTEWVLGALRNLGLGTEDTMYVTIMLFSHVRGTAINLEFESEAVRETGMTVDDYIDTKLPAMGELAGSGRFPLFAELTGNEFDYDLTRLFEFGLTRMLDGLATWLDQL